MKRETNGSFIAALVLIAVAVSGTVSAADFNVTRVPAPGGEVVFANPDEREIMYDQLTYAATRRAGDFVFLSGVEAGPMKGEGTDSAAFKVQLRRAFQAIQNSLVASGANFADVVQMQTFHNCKTPNFSGDLQAQLEALIAVKSEFMKPPYSTWTAVCIDRHYSDNTVVEIQMTAYAPKVKQ